jgi:hypothetical protein
VGRGRWEAEEGKKKEMEKPQMSKARVLTVNLITCNFLWVRMFCNHFNVCNCGSAQLSL